MDQIIKEAKVAAFMTAPRYEAVWARNVIDLALRRAGIPLIVSGGVFYGQCMERMLEEAIDSGVEIALTVDFDSVFTVEHVHRLLGVLAGQDYIDALAAMQCRRGSLFPLFTQGGNELIEFDGLPIKATTAHFGLTAIKLDRLVDVPKPWLWSQPDANGDWSDTDKVDADIYFWKKFKAAGKRIYQANHIKIGHIQVVSTWPTNDWQIKHQYLSDWTERGKPEECK